jgi:hypothetical protein
MNDSLDLSLLSSLLLRVRKLSLFLNIPFNQDPFAIRIQNCSSLSEYNSIHFDLSSLYSQLYAKAKQQFISDDSLLFKSSPNSIYKFDFSIYNSFLSASDPKFSNYSSETIARKRKDDLIALDVLSELIHSFFFEPNLKELIPSNFFCKQNWSGKIVSSGKSFHAFQPSYVKKYCDAQFQDLYNKILAKKDTKDLENELESIHNAQILAVESLYKYAFFLHRKYYINLESNLYKNFSVETLYNRALAFFLMSDKEYMFFNDYIVQKNLCNFNDLTATSRNYVACYDFMLAKYVERSAFRVCSSIASELDEREYRKVAMENHRQLVNKAPDSVHNEHSLKHSKKQYISEQNALREMYAQIEHTAKGNVGYARTDYGVNRIKWERKWEKDNLDYIRKMYEPIKINEVFQNYKRNAKLDPNDKRYLSALTKAKLIKCICNITYDLNVMTTETFNKFYGTFLTNTKIIVDSLQELPYDALISLTYRLLSLQVSDHAQKRRYDQITYTLNSTAGFVANMLRPMYELLPEKEVRGIDIADSGSLRTKFDCMFKMYTAMFVNSFAETYLNYKQPIYRITYMYNECTNPAFKNLTGFDAYADMCMSHNEIFKTLTAELPDVNFIKVGISHYEKVSKEERTKIGCENLKKIRDKQKLEKENRIPKPISLAEFKKRSDEYNSSIKEYDKSISTGTLSKICASRELRIFPVRRCYKPSENDVSYLMYKVHRYNGGETIIVNSDGTIEYEANNGVSLASAQTAPEEQVSSSYSTCSDSSNQFSNHFNTSTCSSNDRSVRYEESNEELDDNLNQIRFAQMATIMRKRKLEDDKKYIELVNAINDAGVLPQLDSKVREELLLSTKEIATEIEWYNKHCSKLGDMVWSEYYNEETHKYTFEEDVDHLIEKYTSVQGQVARYSTELERNTAKESRVFDRKKKIINKEKV